METPKLIDVTPFHPIVIKSHYDFDWKTLKPVCENLIKTTPRQVVLEEDNGKSSVYNKNTPHTMKEFKKFYEWLQPIVNHIIIDTWGYHPEIQYGPVQSWVNIHGKGGVTTEHAHGQSQLVVAAYFNLPADGGYIEYRDPLEYQKLVHYRDKESEWKWNEVKAVTGDILIFPGWLIHRTQPSQSTEDRWVLTTNVAPLKPKSAI